MKSDPALREAFIKQCRTFGPGFALLAWKGQPGMDQDEMIDMYTEEMQREVDKGE